MSPRTKAKLVGSAAQKDRMGGASTFNAWKVDPGKLYSPRSEPDHPEHASWLERTDPANPEYQVLLGLMRANGTHEGQPIIVYSDGGRICVAEGDRRMACANALIAERKAAGNRGPITLRALTTKDPVLARNLGNAGRSEDTPLALARRFRASAEALGAGVAAASMGMRLDYAQMLVKCLSLDADLQARVNRRELPPDVAVRAAKVGGSAAVREVVAKATDAAGKVEPRAARRAAREASPPRARSLPRAKVVAIVDALANVRAPQHPHAPLYSCRDVRALLEHVLGDVSAVRTAGLSSSMRALLGGGA